MSIPVSMPKKIALGLGVLVLAFLVGAGLVYITKSIRGGLAPGSGTEGSGTKGDSGSTSKTLPTDIGAVVENESLEFTAEVFCANCFYGIGDPQRHSIVFISKDHPKMVIPLPNTKLAELEKITGSCADGSFEVTVKGTGSRYNDKNYVTISSFTRRRIKEGSGTKGGSETKGSETKEGSNTK